MYGYDINVVCSVMYVIFVPLWKIVRSSVIWLLLLLLILLVYLLKEELKDTKGLIRIRKVNIFVANVIR
jgi:hypothetical protein